MAAEPILLVENLTRALGTRSVLRVERLALYSGQIVGIAGGNGSGKSALLQVLAPHVLLLDEPFTAGDAGHRRLVCEALQQARRELQGAILLTALDPEELLGVADQIYFLQNGRLFEYVVPGKDLVTRSEF